MMIDNASQAERGRSVARHPYTLRKAIAAVKAAISIEGYLSDRGVQVRGDRARCLVHDGENLQSFAIYPDEGRWYCFRCSEGGDVIDLAQAVEGGDVWEAMFLLAQRYGVELPQRDDTWHECQGDKARVREGARHHLAAVYQRRVKRLYAPLVLVGGENPQEELQELEKLSAALWPTSLTLAQRRVSGEE
jgi:DNA primase